MLARTGATLLIWILAAFPARSAEGPAYLPVYDLAITFDTLGHNVQFRERVTWTNMTAVATDKLVFNFSPHYKIPDGDEFLLAKTLELLRLPSSYGIDHQGRHGNVRRATMVGAGNPDLPFAWKPGNQTGLEVTLPAAVPPGGSVTVELVGDVVLPNKQGRWGQWGGISYFTNALPVVAYYDGEWRDVPFVPWHQPFWNEAGRFTAAITLPESERLACSAAVASVEQLPGGWQKVTTKPFVGRDFAIVSSADFHEHHATATLPSGKVVDVKCMALARHDFYGRELANIAAAAIPVYSKWFGDFPYEQFTIVESFFGWNGNECSGMVLIDERVFDFPTFAHGYVEYLMSHETCHQWWYNLVGTNGYSETFMDEGAATYFTHRMLDGRHGKNNRLLNWPDGFDWMPNIGRENYRNASITGAIRRNDIPAAAGDLPAFGHLYGLFSGAYDRGSRIFGLIEARMGEAAYFDFLQLIVKKYSFKVLTAEMFRGELIAYSGPQSKAMWDELYERWVYGKGLVDWKVESVSVERRSGPRMERGGVRVAVEVAQVREYDEPTTVGFQFADGDGYPVRVPVSVSGGGVAGATDPLETEVIPLRPGVVSVRVTLPRAPTQVTVDPDGVLMDADPANNYWKQGITTRVVPFYTFLYDTDLTNDYDKWNATVGPWYYGALYPDPWYTRATIAGARAGIYKTQQFAGGVYVGARPDYRDLVFGVDGLWDHFPFPRTQVGFNYERRIAGPWGRTDGVDGANRAVLYGRYILRYGSSLYLPPISYVDTYGTYSDNFLPFARTTSPGAERPGYVALAGAHYRLNLLTPYWNPERGVWVDATYAGGVGDLGGDTVGVHQGRLDLATTQKLPDGLGYLSSVKVAGRGLVQGALPRRGQFFALGGSTLFRGFDLAERQGSLLWAANAEVRLPIVREARWDVADHIAGVRNVQLAGFYDVGSVYTDGHAVGGGAAHALGLGLRVDLAFFSFIERAVVRLDAAKTINAATPWQVWFGVQQPF